MPQKGQRASSSALSLSLFILLSISLSSHSFFISLALGQSCKVNCTLTILCEYRSLWHERTLLAATGHLKRRRILLELPRKWQDWQEQPEQLLQWHCSPLVKLVRHLYFFLFLSQPVPCLSYVIASSCYVTCKLTGWSKKEKRQLNRLLREKACLSGQVKSN